MNHYDCEKQIKTKILIYSFLSLTLVSCFKTKIDIDYKSEALVPSLSPSKIFLRGGIKLTLKGSHFKEGVMVDLGSTACQSVTVVDAQTLTCIAPSAPYPKTLDVTVYYTDTTKHTLKNALQYTTDGFNKVELVYGSLSHAGTLNGTGKAARFNAPTKPFAIGNYLYISDTGNHVIRRMNLSTNAVEDFAGKKGKPGYVDATGIEAHFDSPMGLVGVGTDLYVADNMNCKIRKIDTLTKVVTTVVGANKPCAAQGYGEDDVNGNNASIENPLGLTTDGTSVYFSGEYQYIRKFSVSGNNPVTTVIGSADIETIVDIVYTNNALYVINYASAYSIFKIDLAGSPLTAAPYAGSTAGIVDGIGAAAKFSTMGALETDGSYLYVSDTRNYRLRKVDLSNASVTTIAGSGTMGNLDGIGVAARINRPGGLFLKNGLLYFTTFGGHNIRTFDLSSSQVSTIAGNDKE